jgi:hypothetical protein
MPPVVAPAKLSYVARVVKRTWATLDPLTADKLTLLI